MNDERKKVPQTLEECYVTDYTASRLWQWSAWIERAGKIFLGIIIVLGIIVSISGAMVTDYRGDAEFSFAAFITSVLVWAIYAFIECCAEYKSYFICCIVLCSKRRGNCCGRNK